MTILSCFRAAVRLNAPNVAVCFPVRPSGRRFVIRSGLYRKPHRMLFCTTRPAPLAASRRLRRATPGASIG